MPNYNKEIQFIRQAITRLNIDLSNKTILTEIGNNYYFFLPFIAALSGAKKVYAWTAQNDYFNCEEIIIEAQKLAHELGVNDIIEFTLNQKPITHIQSADIITNSGFIRPLHKDFLVSCKNTVAIALMYEAWELRETDIDIEYCKKNNLRVAGTNESHPEINVFESVGPLAIKLAFESGLEVFQNNILIWSDDDFGTISEAYFLKMNAKKVVRTTNKEVALEFIKEVDFIYFCANHEKRTIISNRERDAIFSIDEIVLRNPNVKIVHLYGKFNCNELIENGLTVYPLQDGKAEYMSKTLNHLGMQPTLNLFCAGFKVGEELSENSISSLTQII